MRGHLHGKLVISALNVLLLTACYDPMGHWVSNRHTAGTMPVLSADSWGDGSATGPVLATLPWSITEQSDGGYGVDLLAHEPVALRATPAVYIVAPHSQVVDTGDPLNRLRTGRHSLRGSVRVSF